MRTSVQVLASAALLAAVGAPPAQASSVIQFGRIYYNAPGSDSSANTNGEYVAIRNLSSRSVSLTGWTLRDAANHVYTFGNYALPAGKTVIVRTGKGTNGALVRYWGSGSHIWNNDGDKAYLRNSSGTQMDYCAWGSGSASYKDC